MTLSPFNPKLLNFIYELTKLDGYKSSAEIAKSIRLENGRSVTPKTVRNWFNYLSRPYNYLDFKFDRKFSYFPAIFKNKMGLSMINVFYEDPSENLHTIFPFKNYVGRLHNKQTNRPVLLVEYLVPMDNLRQFKAILMEIKKQGFCSDISFYETGPSFKITSPFHKIIDSNGIFHYERNDQIEIKKQIKDFSDFLEKDFEVEFSHAIKRDPFIIPVLNEYLYEHRSSVQVWKAIKSKIGDSIWDYIRRFRSKSDGVGLKRVQNIMGNLKNYELFNQMRVVYFPIELGINFTIYLVINNKSVDSLIENTEDIALNSIFTNIFPIERKKILITFLLNGESLQKLFGLMSNNKIEKLLFFDHFKSVDIMTTARYSTFDYSKIFDPINCSWKYNQYEMLEEIKNLC